MSRVRRSTWNYFTVVAYSATTLIIGLLATRLLVAWLGTERLGAFRAVSDWSGYLGLLEVGLGGALMPLIARAINRGDQGDLAGTMASGIDGYLRILPLNLLGGVLLVAFIPSLVPTPSSLGNDLRLAVAIIMFGALMLPLAPLRPLWEADHRGSMVTGILILQSVIITAGSVLFAKIGWGVSGQALALLLGILAYSAVLFVQTLRRHRDVLRWFTMPAPVQMRARLWTLNWPTLTLALSGRLSLLTDNIVIAHFLGASAVVPFFITQRLPQIVVGQLHGIGNSTWAGMLQVYEMHGTSAFNDRLLELTELIVIFGMSALIPIVAYNAVFIDLWMPGMGLYGGGVLTLLASCNGMVMAVSSLWGWMFSGTGRIAVLVPLNIVSMVVNVIFSIGATATLKHLYPTLALLGPVLGTSIAFLTCQVWWMPKLLHRSFSTPIAKLVIATMKPMVMSVPIGVVVFWLARRYPPHHWFTLGLEMAAVGTVNLLLAWALILNSKQRQNWMERLRRGVTVLNCQPDAAVSLSASGNVAAPDRTSPELPLDRL